MNMTGSSANFRFLHVMSSSTQESSDAIASSTPLKNTLRHLLYDEHIATPSGGNFPSQRKLSEGISCLP